MKKNAFNKVVGYESVKKELIRITDVLKNTEVYKRAGVYLPRGILLFGSPGVGKTLMAKCLIEESGRNCFICRKNQPDGEFVNYIRKIFNEAVENEPSIVFLDDMDKYANTDSDHKNAEEFVTIQSCIDDVKGKDVFVVATANGIENIPSSLLRTGRFDTVTEIGKPNIKEAGDIIKTYLQGKNIEENIDVDFIAKLLNGKSCAILETVMNEAGILAVYDRSDKITMKHITLACIHVAMDDEIETDESVDYLKTLSDGNCISSQIIYHEAGHALIHELMFPGTVTCIYVREVGGRLRDGTTSFYTESDNRTVKVEEKTLVCALAGMAAVEQKFGVKDGGCNNDINRAYRIASSLIEDICIRGFHLHGNSWGARSQELQSSKEKAIASMLENSFSKAKELIAANMNFLDNIASELAEKKILCACDIERIKEHCNVSSLQQVIL